MGIDHSHCKKILLPAMTLMLCIAAIAGTGYAYSGTYNDSIPAGIGVNGCYLQVGSVESIRIGEMELGFVLDTFCDRSTGSRTYSFDPVQNDPVVFIDPGETRYVDERFCVIIVEAGGEAVSGRIAVTDDFRTGGFVTGLDLTPDASAFHIEAGGMLEVVIRAEFTFSSAGIDDGNVDDLVIPGFTMRVVAESFRTEMRYP